MTTYTYPPHRRHRMQRQRGVVLLFSLIALLILMIGAVALVRSFNTSLLNAGSVAFKKDLQIRSEAIVARALRKVKDSATGLAVPTVNAQVARSINFSPRILDTNDQGIPLILLASDADFDAAVGDHALNDIDMPADGIKIRYVIDRQCDMAGQLSSLTPANCVSSGEGTLGKFGGSTDAFIRAENAAELGGGVSRAGAVTMRVVYRMTIRAIGPRNTLAFYQTTFTL